MLLENTTALVTGASRGAGAAIALALAREGAAVCVNYFTSREGADATVAAIEAEGGSAFAFKADVTDPAAVQRMVDEIVQRYGRLDAVINNALPAYRFDPSADYVRLETLTWEHVDSQIGAVRGAINTVQAALPTFREQQYGKVVNISTNLLYNPVVTYHDYTAAKGALAGLTRTMAAELGPVGVRVNLVAGGLLQTTDASAATTPEVFELVAHSTPLRKTITPEEFARAVIFFASPLSDSVTGQSLAVDGGLTMP